MSDTDLQRRLDTAEHLIAILLANQRENPRILVRQYPPTFHLDDAVLSQAEGIWNAKNRQELV